MKLQMALIAGLVLATLNTSASSEENLSPKEILRPLVSVQTKDGVFLRKMIAPISFAMGPLGGKDPKYANDVAFFKGLSYEVRDFLKATLKEGYSTDPAARPISVAVLFPDFQKNGDDAALTKIFEFGDATVRGKAHDDYYLVECRDLVVNFEDPYSNQTPPDDQWSVEMAASTSVELSVRGANYDRDEVTRCLYRHVLAALGLRGEVPEGLDSVLAKNNPAIRPTDLDRRLVELLYESNAEAGAPMDAAFPR